MPQTAIICPSGLAGEVRNLTAKEARVFLDKRSSAAGALFDSILQPCWVQTTDPGMYSFSGSPDWGSVVMADRFYAVMQIRRITYGDKYAFGVQCQNMACRRKFEWEVDLSGLPVKLLPDATKDAFRAGNRLETSVDGRKVWYKLTTGDDERRIGKEVERGGLADGLVLGLMARVVEVEGIDAGDAKAKRKWLEDMSLGDATALLDRFDETDGGVNTSIEVECINGNCMTQQTVQLPFDRGFFLPRKAAG